MSQHRRPAPASAAPAHDGLVVATFGRHCLVESPDGTRHICHPRGKRSEAVVGDRVDWITTGDEGVIERVQPRRNLFYRQDELRTKSFAANLDQVLLLIAAEPTYSDHQLSRALITAEAQRIRPLIVLNKADLRGPFAAAWQRLAPYRNMGYEVLPLCLREGEGTPGLTGEHLAQLAALRGRLTGHTTLVLGPSGAGKSSLINTLVPAAQTATAEISKALNSGKHTTTRTSWYWLDAPGDPTAPADATADATTDATGTAPRNSALIDSPGFQEFGLHHIEATALASLMPDLAEHLGHCRFYNCTHLHEPGCAVRDRVDASAETPETASHPGFIAPARYKIYSELFAELSGKQH